MSINGKDSPQAQGEQVRQSIRGGADLQPQLQRFPGLLPQIAHAPPALQIVKQGFDTPALAGMSGFFRILVQVLRAT